MKTFFWSRNFFRRNFRGKFLWQRGALPYRRDISNQLKSSAEDYKNANDLDTEKQSEEEMLLRGGVKRLRSLISQIENEQNQAVKNEIQNFFQTELQQTIDDLNNDPALRALGIYTAGNDFLGLVFPPTKSKSVQLSITPNQFPKKTAEKSPEIFIFPEITALIKQAGVNDSEIIQKIRNIPFTPEEIKTLKTLDLL